MFEITWIAALLVIFESGVFAWVVYKLGEKKEDVVTVGIATVVFLICLLGTIAPAVTANNWLYEMQKMLPTATPFG